MKRYFSFLCVALISINISASAQKALCADSLAADFDFLVKLLESSHPDPYSGFGGKVFFHEQAHNLKESLKKNPCSIEEFQNRASAFISTIRDGHTQLYTPYNNGQKDLYLPLLFKCVAEGLIVRAIPIEHKNLLGSRLLAVNGNEMNDIIAFADKNYVSENLYGTYSALEWRLRSKSFIHRLLAQPTDSISMRLLTPDQQEVTLKLPFIDYSNPDNYVNLAVVPNAGFIPKNHLEYSFLDADKQTMYLKISEIYARDCIEYMHDNKWNFYSTLANYYRAHIRKPVPADTLKAIREIPSFTQVFAKMLNSMKKNKAKNLIIDLRDNSGGWTPITLPSLYLMFGDQYLHTDMQTKYYTLLSPLYLKKINNTIRQFNASRGSDFSIGDYTFYTQSDSDSALSPEEIRNRFIDDCISSDKKTLKAIKGKPIYKPSNIYVLIDNNTFSAAFHYAFYLWKMGATIVGIPCKQAPNTFMEQTPFELPYSHLKGSISNSFQAFLPGTDKRAKTFYPDMEMTYDDYKKYNFNAQAEILFLLDHINSPK